VSRKDDVGKWRQVVGNDGICCTMRACEWKEASGMRREEKGDCCAHNCVRRGGEMEWQGGRSMGPMIAKTAQCQQATSSVSSRNHIGIFDRIFLFAIALEIVTTKKAHGTNTAISASSRAQLDSLRRFHFSLMGAHFASTKFENCKRFTSVASLCVQLDCSLCIVWRLCLCLTDI
jgi:hypothetical protein